MSEVDKNNTEQAPVDGTESTPDAGTTPEKDSPTAFYKDQATTEKARADSAEKELEKARHALAQKRIEDKDKKEVGADPTPAQAVDPTEIAKQVRQQIAEENNQKFRESLPDLIEDKEELAQVEYFLDNVIKHTGNPQQDLALAVSLANGKKYQEVNAEMARAMGTKGKDADLPSNKVDGDGEAKLSSADRAFIAQADKKLGK